MPRALRRTILPNLWHNGDCACMIRQRICPAGAKSPAPGDQITETSGALKDGPAGELIAGRSLPPRSGRLGFEGPRPPAGVPRSAPGRG